MRNALTFDVEDYFHVSAFANNVSRASWDNLPSRVEANTQRILDLLAEAGSSATFFTLGWVALRFPRIVRAIADAGHEVACHSDEHRRVFDLSPQEFREDTVRAKRVLEDASGQQVKGYRAPSFSITQRSLWALNILVELGFEYDSSIFPVDHPNYGMPRVSRFPFRVKTAAGSLAEFPMATIRLGGRRSPFAGGAYLRFLPYSYTRWGIRYVNLVESKPICVYLHPWELDPDQPRLNSGLTATIRHYVGLRGTIQKLKKLLAEFEFAPLGSLIQSSQIKEFEITV
jgi:polysaccharide deacetylase family protein (PEP-CTERM system associated)